MDVVSGTEVAGVMGTKITLPLLFVLIPVTALPDIVLHLMLVGVLVYEYTEA